MNKLFIQLFLGLLFPSMAICQRPEIILPKGHQAYIDDIVFSPDGSLLASAGDVPEGNVILWDVQSGREIKTLKTSDGGHLAFSPDGKLLAAAGHAGLVVWKLDDYTQIQIDDSEGAGWVYSVKFNHSGSLLAIGMEYVGYGKHYIRIYDVENHKLLKKLSGNITPCALAFSNNDSLLASGGGNGDPEIVEIWNPYTTQLIHTIKNTGNPCHLLEFSLGDTTIIIGKYSDGVGLFDIVSSKKLFYDKKGCGHGRFTSDHKNFVYSTFSSYNYNSSRSTYEHIIRTLNINDFSFCDIVTCDDGHIDYSASKHLIAGKNGQGVIRLWDAKNGNEIYMFGQFSPKHLQGKPEIFRSFWFDKKGDHLIFKISDTSYSEFSISTNSLSTYRILPKKLSVVKQKISSSQQSIIDDAGEMNSVEHFAISSDNKLIALSKGWRSIDIVDGNSGELVRSIETESMYASSFNFFPDSHILVAEHSCGVAFWDIDADCILGYFILLPDDQWVCVTPKYLFDGSEYGVYYPHCALDKKPILLKEYSPAKKTPALLKNILHMSK